MFNGIIFNTGKIKTIKKYNKTILIGIKTKSRFSSKILDHLFLAMAFV